MIPRSSARKRPSVAAAIFALSCATQAAHDVAPRTEGLSALTPEGGSIVAIDVPAVDATTMDAMTADTTAVDPPAVSLPPLVTPSPFVPLVVPEHRDAVVSVPVGATERRPVVLALHGNYDRPEWQCTVWREAMKGHPFVLCPRGEPRRDAPASLDRWTYGRSSDVRREIDAALAALRERFGDYIAPGPIVYVGFSLGAILGVGIVAGNAERFPLAVLIEGGQSGWTEGRAKSYAASGGKRVLFACGQRSCKAETKTPERVLARAGIETRSVYGGEVGHTYDGPVAEEIARALPWLIADDPRWSAR